MKRKSEAKKEGDQTGGLEPITTSEYVILETGENFLKILSRSLNEM